MDVHRRMHLSKFALIIFISLAIISTLVAKIQDIITIGDDIIIQETDNKLVKGPFPDDQNRHLFWFMQISDIHLSIFNDLQRGPDFTKFCSQVVDAVQPKLVLATGDLTDARTSDHLGSQQFEDEWRMYRRILNDTQVTSRTIWLDIRGNHDNFNLISSSSPHNYYRQYSVKGPTYPRSYNFSIHHDTETYVFIGMDACVEPGPKRPFNFLGILDEKDMQMLLEMKAAAQRQSNYTIWFGHYPTSTISSAEPGVRELMRHSGPYLCGHLHTLGGLVPQMYTLQSNGVLELELGDFKDNRRFRVVAIDHGLLSFEDFYLGQWPLLVVTNPKPALLAMGALEPLYRLLHSTHIRVLVFSPVPLTLVEYQLGDAGPWQPMNQSSEEPRLYTAPWNPLQFLEGLHTLALRAEDEAGNQVTKRHQFSLDGSRPSFPLGGRLVLMGHISVTQVIFSLSFLLVMLPFCGLRLLAHWRKEKQGFFGPRNSFGWRWLFKLYLLASTDTLFWPLMLLALYVAIGPWFVGELVTGYVGFCFAWGLYINGTFLPGGLTYLVGALYYQTFFLPLVLLLAHGTYLRWLHLAQHAPAPSRLVCQVCCYQLAWAAFACWQLFWVVGCLLSYGWMATMLGFGSTWSAPLGALLCHWAHHLPASSLPGLDQQPDTDS